MLIVFGFGLFCGLLIYIVVDLDRTLNHRRKVQRLERTIRQQENTIITQQNNLFAANEENKRLSALLAVEQARPSQPVDFTRYAHLTPFGRVNTTRMH